MEVSAPRVYLSYAAEDDPRVRELYDRLAKAGFKPWMFSKDILPGTNIEAAIPRAMRESDSFLALLSKNSTQRHGLYEKEWARALELQAERGPDAVYLMPVLLEDCPVPDVLAGFASVDLSKPDGWDRLIASLQRLAPQLARPEPPADLLSAIEKGECVLFTGAGLSRPAGLPLWRDLVTEILTLAVEKEAVPGTMANSFRLSLESGAADSVADSLVSSLGVKYPKEGPLEEYLRKRFLGSAIKPTPYHAELARIGFSAALTTNFDTLLEQIFPQVAGRIYTVRDASKLLDNLAHPENFFILKMVGAADRPDSLLVSPGQFRDAVDADPLLRQFFERLFFARTVLFLGSSLGGILSNLDALQIRPTTPGRVHYALVGVTGQEWHAQADLLKRRYNVEVLPYTLGDPSQIQPDALKFLKALPAQSAKSAEGTRTREPAALKRIVLNNIGPFQNLELELRPGWNVILGDNGVGKSNILRAIALALCGEKASSWAGRVLRYGSNSGSITLETTDGDRGRRRVELTRPSRTNDDIGMKVIATSQLETQPGLAIGFPPLRQSGSQPVTGPAPKPGTAYTVPEDLLPLVSGEPDPRMQDFKKSLVDLDFQRNQDRDDANAQKRNQQKFDDLFHVIQVMTEGLNLRYVGYDSATSQVLVETDDGKVPIEVVSQGTQSLMGWVGMLLERLYDVYPKDPAPRERYALVAIDEIDAHMHPAWQQSIVPRLTELFPRVQFIATTHAPLIVGGLPASNIIRLARNPEGKVVRLMVEEDMTKGRADQILTSNLFGLETTLDKTTQRVIEEMQGLMLKPKPEPGDETRLEELHRQLELRIPVVEDTPAERRAFEFVDALLTQQVLELTGSVDQALLEANKTTLAKKAQQLLDEVQHKQRIIP